MTGFNVTVKVVNHNPDTIFNKLAAKLGRDPNERECRDEIRRIMS